MTDHSYIDVTWTKAYYYIWGRIKDDRKPENKHITGFLSPDYNFGEIDYAHQFEDLVPAKLRILRFVERVKNKTLSQYDFDVESGLYIFKLQMKGKYFDIADSFAKFR